MPIKKIGFTLKPLPHVYVSASDNGLSMYRTTLFMLSGNITTIILFLISTLNFSINEFIYYAFAFQLIIEMNPFYSDYSLLFSNIKVRSEIKNSFVKYRKYPTKEDLNTLYKQSFENHWCSKEWYIHLFVWMVIIIILLSPKYILSTI